MHYLIRRHEPVRMNDEKNTDRNRDIFDLSHVAYRLLTEKLFRGEFRPTENGAALRGVKRETGIDVNA